MVTFLMTLWTLFKGICFIIGLTVFVYIVKACIDLGIKRLIALWIVAIKKWDDSMFMAEMVKNIEEVKDKIKYKPGRYETCITWAYIFVNKNCTNITRPLMTSNNLFKIKEDLS